MQSYIIHFIRHGMTKGNVNGQYVGVLDIPVCEEGIKKLNDLKNNFKYPNVQEIYSSPLIRCTKTAEIIYPNQKCNTIEDLKECNFGDWEGKSPTDLNNDPLYHEWIKQSGEIVPPNGESWADFYKRICKAFELIVESMMRRKVTETAIFTHGVVIMTLLSNYGLPKAKIFEWAVDNGCGYSVRITPGLWMRDKVFEVYEKVPLGSNNEIEGNFKELIKNFEK